jgi:hypothetical protein
MKNITFEDYLQNIHAQDYCGLDDEMSEDYEDWLRDLDIQEVIDYAEAWGKKLIKDNK